MQDDLLKLYSKLDRKTNVITNPISLNIENYCKKHDLEKINKQNYILCVGRLEEQKSFSLRNRCFCWYKK